MDVDNFAQKELQLNELANADSNYRLPVFQLGTDASDIQSSFVDINFGFNPDRFILHRAFCVEQLNNYAHTASTKTRAQVRGGGKKPWKQKGTGRARAGSSSSPLWRSGGITFGPQPRTVYKKINSKERVLALKTLFFNATSKTSLVAFGESPTTSSLGLNKTKHVLKFLSSLKINAASNEKVLIVVSNSATVNLLEAGVRNLPKVNLVNSNNLSLWDILWADFLIVEKRFYLSLFT
jgi:large subunit ribosomal protein L4